MLTVENIHTYYDESHILQGVSLQLERGEALALLGRNGAGKTTTLRSIVNWTPPRSGRVVFAGREITGLPTHRVARAGIGIVPQGRRIFPELSVRENLTLGARAGGEWTLDKIYELFPRLRERAALPGNRLSGGEQQMLAIGRALLTNPQLLLLDEPSEGLAPLIVREIGSILKTLKAHGLSILLVEQNLALALEVADQAAILSKGQVVYEGSAQELAADHTAQSRHLGV